MKVLVVGETVNGEVQNITYELVSCAKKLGDYVTLIMSDADVSSIDGRVIKVNAGEPNPVYYKIVERVIELEKPDLIVFGNTSIGVDLSSQLSTNFPIATRVYNVKSSKNLKEVEVRSMAYGGKVVVVLKLRLPAIVVINAGSYDAGEGMGKASVEELELKYFDIDDVEFLRYIKPEVEDVDISKADVVVSVGRGIGDEANIELAEKLANLLDGVVAGSRPIVDQGWLPKTRQVGKSGKTVTGKLYIALGISGATEHTEGIKAKNVIAVNTDKSAPIFRISRFGAIADVTELLPVLIDKIREIREK
ncbi:MAG: electron transfer flavoprotein subunit alpha/FixB family protein [Archaeoglobus sp.]|nr:MAG: electron transfer flavoprotein subunit alpha/FixB family protein [Archaeoglobus sp.]